MTVESALNDSHAAGRRAYEHVGRGHFALGLDELPARLHDGRGHELRNVVLQSDRVTETGRRWGAEGHACRTRTQWLRELRAAAQ